MKFRDNFLKIEYCRVFFILLPFFVLSLHLSIMALTLSESDFIIMTGLMLGYILPPAGKETVIPLGIALGIPWWSVALSIILVDLETALFMAFNFDYVHRLPILGPLIRDLTNTTEDMIARHQWLTGLYALGVILMVMVPVLGSGGVRGSIAGRLLGLTPIQTFLAIAIGASIGCFGIALGADQILSYLCATGLLSPDIFIRVCPG